MLRDKNALRFFLASSVRIDHVIRSHSALPFSSHSLPLAPAEDVPRAVILVVGTTEGSPSIKMLNKESVYPYSYKEFT